MAFGIKFIPLTPAAQLPSHRDNLADITNTSTHFPSEEVNKAIHCFDALMNDFFRNYSQNCGENDYSMSLVGGSMPQINIVNDDKMEVDNKFESLEDYDIFLDLAFFESINSQHFDFPFSMGDQSSTPESSEYDLGSTQMAELRALLLETFPDGMPKEIDYKSILADQYVPSDPLDPSFWNYFQDPVQPEYTPSNEQ